MDSFSKPSSWNIIKQETKYTTFKKWTFVKVVLLTSLQDIQDQADMRLSLVSGNCSGGLEMDGRLSQPAATPVRFDSPGTFRIKM